MNSSFVDNYRLLARYNLWFNARLYDACETLDDDARKQDRGAFFGSIHHTLNHIVVADQVWLKRFCQSGVDHGIDFGSLGADVLDLPEGATLSTLLFEDWAALRNKRAQLDAAIASWIEQMPEDFPTRAMGESDLTGLRARFYWGIEPIRRSVSRVEATFPQGAPAILISSNSEVRKTRPIQRKLRRLLSESIGCAVR